MKYIILLCSIVCCADLFAEKKWIGSGQGGWDNGMNWQPSGVPSNVDDIILDNTFQQNNYIIAIPEIVANIHSLSIVPSLGKNIELILPATNKNSPAIVVTDVSIRQGGVFRNSSGLTSGQSIQLNGAIFIFNYGSYIHNSRSAHANDIVAKLSVITGTDRGIFEFDVPGGSYPISLSNRTFGTLILSSAASGGTQTYNASGANPVTINGDLRINSGVQFNVDLTKDMVISGNYIQQGGVFNVASQANNNIIKIQGNITQASTGIITETSGGLPVIELSGNELQLVSAEGNITNSVAVSINNPSGISLMDPLTLPFKLILGRGILKTSATNIITISDSCSVVGGSYSSYIDGPMKKIGNSDFEFPIGKQKDYAPVKLTRTAATDTDEFIAEYFLANPQTIYGSNFESPPIVRISTLEYWSLKRLAGSSSCKLTLSVRTYSQATALDKLVVTRWDAAGSNWKNEGNEMYAGIATGTITSKLVEGSGAFTLGSTVAMQNPLPETAVVFKASRNAGNVELNWNIEKNMAFHHFEIERSYNREEYTMIGKLNKKDDVVDYQWKFEEARVVSLRLKIINKDGDFIYSDIIETSAYKLGCEITNIFPSPFRRNVTITVIDNQDEIVWLVISDMNGRKISTTKQTLNAGKNEIFLSPGNLQPGVYAILLYSRNGIEDSKRFVKL